MNNCTDSGSDSVTDLDESNDIRVEVLVITKA